MTSQSRYADEIINSSDAIQECIEVLPEVASLWVLYQFAETFETFDEEEPVPFKEWLIAINQEQVEELEYQLLNLTMGTTIDMESRTQPVKTS
tara:strand:+ start:132 stop:410 length:279 start_codon:yes stop_codon:yes gene_type:complete